MKLLYDEGVGMNPRRCELPTTRIGNLGPVIRSEPLKSFDTNDWRYTVLKHTATITEHRTIFGLCHLFHGFVPNLGLFAAPQNKKLCDGQQPTS